MTSLFRRIKPAQKFRITKRQIAKFLGIPESLMVKVESWLYVLYVHRLDRGGQFISYRQLLQWKNAVACQIATWKVTRLGRLSKSYRHILTVAGA